MKKYLLTLGILCFCVSAYADEEPNCPAVYIRFTATPVYDHNNMIKPGTCEEHYDKGEYNVQPRYKKFGRTKIGTPGGTVEVTLLNKAKEAIKTDVSTWDADSAGSKVVWKRDATTIATVSGSGVTSFTFTAPLTPISYTVTFNTKNEPKLLKGLQHDGAHYTSVTLSGTGISIKTWEFTQPDSQDPVGTLRAFEYYNGSLVKAVYKKTTQLWKEQHTLPKP